MDAAQTEWPTEIRLVEGGKALKVAFESGATYTLPAEYLRVMSPSAEVQGHSRKERKTVGGKRQVAIIGVEPVGTYAVRLSFDDMHSTGIFTWVYLHDLGQSHPKRWAEYTAELEAAGLSRDRAGEAHSHA
ncbi:gamma-butyrobetaine hydroxylase-like domain-containing protein [Beijerinckia sp. L45]|uniref:gamma-butyrobetaine hydroxylase-like domain-containing protein n=1 Tax=Beijerinckia sp. L45 TaxID=1641855 RepID=UPI00131C6CFD|nr:DUF971 domain-containing protein [Beijerinckia sp. L45]